MKNFLTIFSCFLLINCHRAVNETNSEKLVNIIKNVEIAKDTLRNENLNDTLLIKEYVSKIGNKIRLEGNNLDNISKIVVTNRNGITKKFIVADNSFITSHLSISWENQHFIFLEYGCGAGCWGAKALSLSDNRGVLDFPFKIFSDSLKNVVIYPDKNDNIIIQNLYLKKQISLNLNLCNKTIIPATAIDSVYFQNSETIIIKYIGSDCKPMTKSVNIKQIEN